MSLVKKYGMAAATFSAALGIGFAMQNGDAVAARFGASGDVAQPAAPAAVEVVLASAPDAGPVLMQPAPNAPIAAMVAPVPFSD